MSTGVFWWEPKPLGCDKLFIYLLESWRRKGPELSYNCVNMASAPIFFFLQRILPHVLGLFVISQSDHMLGGNPFSNFSSQKQTQKDRNNKIPKPKAFFLESSLS